MTERPILMNAFSVRGILAGRKTQTRRVIKPQPVPSKMGDGLWVVKAKRSDKAMALINATKQDVVYWTKQWCPYGTVGDRLWVRETWSQDNQPFCLNYRATSHPGAGFKWKPSIHMPRWASRITLEVADVRVERLQDITAYGAMWEGVALAHNPINKMTIEALGNSSSTGLAAIEDFCLLWDSINAKRGYSWESNPWVWVVEFEYLEASND